MVNENYKYVPKVPETFTVSYLETGQVAKKSPLSSAARSKVIPMYGGNYVSPRSITDIDEPAVYGPGKRNFKGLYRQIKSKLGRPSCKISYFSDNFNPSKNYSGMIVYAVDGRFSGMNTGGKASGYKGRSFYLIVQCTNDWPSEVLRDVGQGRVHHYLIKSTLGYDYNQDIVCCGGFTWHEGRLKTSSVWLNGRDQKGCDSDGSKYLSEPERILVEYCFNKYRQYGKHHIFEIPDYIDRQLS